MDRHERAPMVLVGRELHDVQRGGRFPLAGECGAAMRRDVDLERADGEGLRVVRDRALGCGDEVEHRLTRHGYSRVSVEVQVVMYRRMRLELDCEMGRAL